LDSENEFVDVDSFSDAAPEARKEVAPDAADEPAVEAEVAVPTEAPVAAEVSAADISQPALSRDEASPEFSKELELTVQRGSILPNTLLWSKFGRSSPKIKLPLLLWPLSTSASVHLIAANY
jgi:hypothetical protein